MIVKSFKGLAVKTCHEEFGRLVLMAIFDCVDDTVLVKKNIVQVCYQSHSDMYTV